MKKKFLSLLSLLILAAFTACSQNTATDSSGKASEGGLSGAISRGEAPAHAEKDSDGVRNDIGEADDAGIGGVDAADIGGLEASPEHPSDEYHYVDEYYYAEGDAAAGGVFKSGESGIHNDIPAAAGTLTAGEWVDNDHYSFWQNLYQNAETEWEAYRTLWNRAYSSRIFVTVAAGGKPVENETVTLISDENMTLWTAKTDNEGKAYLFCDPSELSGGGLMVRTSLGAEEKVNSEKNTAAFNYDDGSVKNRGKSLDLALIVDTTGSMSDELNYLQKELESVISRAAKDNGNIPIRLSVSFYRDDGDEYVVRDFDFTDNINEAIQTLNSQSSDGGGDTPEKVNAALDAAINKLSWEADSTKLAFIILDAPPHSDDFEAVNDMNILTEQAAAKGIRLIPILASGGDKETEFLMRDFALKTGGSYLFLTDDSGVSAGQHIEPTIGDYTVEKLNDLMVKVIDRYLNNYNNPADYKNETVETKATETEPPYMEWAEGVTMELIKRDLTKGSLDFEIRNNTEIDYTYGYGFDLEELKDGQWTRIEPSEYISVIDLAVMLEAHSCGTFNAPISEYFGELSSGKYRIVLNLASSAGEWVTVYGEFGVSVTID